MIKKTLIYMLLILLIYTVMGSTVVFATPPINEEISPTPPSEPPETPPGDGGDWACDNDHVTTAGTSTNSSCGINVTNKYRTTVYMDLYDSDGTYLGNPFDDTFKNKKFKAGMYIGIDFFEEFRVTSTATINPYCTTASITITCRTYYNNCSSSSSQPPSSSSLPPISKPGGGNKPGNPSFSPRTLREKYDNESNENKSVSNENARITPLVSVPTPIEGDDDCIGYYDTEITTGSCPAGSEQVSVSCTTASCTPKTVSECRDEAEAQLEVAADTENEHYTANRCDVNDIAGSCTIPVAPQRVFNEGEVLPKDRNSSTITRDSYLHIKYNPKKACMNVKTAAINYIEYTGECDSESEITVKQILNKDSEPVGLYFIPLNTKTTQNYKYEMTSKEKISSDKAELCSKIIESHRKDGNWRYLLLDADKKKFSVSTSADEAKRRVANGCYYNTTVNFIIDQEFYKETGKNTARKIKGYELFYRPIDIKNPFPNGISDNSYWKDLINLKDNTIKVTEVTRNGNNVKTYDLNQSFNEMSYSIYNINAKSVRDYTRNHFYTSWLNMNPSGSSDFVNDYVTRVHNQQYYRLGCGPANGDWEGCYK